MLMLTEIYELITLYRIYRKLNAIKTLSAVDEKYCQEIKSMILAGGCIYIKFAQWVISRLRSEPGPSIQFVVDYFDDIFDQCPTHPIKHCMTTYEESTGQPLSSLIQLDTLKTIASGSIGQVYRAELLNPVRFCNCCDRQFTKDYLNQTAQTTCPDCACELQTISTVAIKIKHPEIDEQIQRKVRLFTLLTRLQSFKLIKDALCLHMDFMEFINNLTAQADFTNEHRNCQRFRANFKGNQLVYFPYIITGTRNVLVTEFVTGETLEQLTDYNQLKCCYNYACMITQMLVIDNFCHGDLHHGNWKVRPVKLSSSGESITDYQLIVYDYGICFSGSDSKINQTIIESFETNDAEAIVNVITELIDGEYDEHVLFMVREAVMHYREQELDLAFLFNNINNMLVRYNCKLTSNGMNTVLLLSLIDTTLRKHNLVGGNISSDKLPRTNPSSIIRAKNLDLIAYAKSRMAYPEFVEYMEARYQRQVEKAQDETLTNLGIFSGCLNNNLQLDDPE